MPQHIFLRLRGIRLPSRSANSAFSFRCSISLAMFLFSNMLRGNPSPKNVSSCEHNSFSKNSWAALRILSLKISQIGRPSLSVPYTVVYLHSAIILNIAEGVSKFTRRNREECFRQFVHFLFSLFLAGLQLSIELPALILICSINDRYTENTVDPLAHSPYTRGLLRVYFSVFNANVFNSFTLLNTCKVKSKIKLKCCNFCWDLSVSTSRFTPSGTSLGKQSFVSSSSAFFNANLNTAIVSILFCLFLLLICSTIGLIFGISSAFFQAKAKSTVPSLSVDDVAKDSFPFGCSSFQKASSMECQASSMDVKSRAHATRVLPFRNILLSNGSFMILLP